MAYSRSISRVEPNESESLRVIHLGNSAPRNPVSRESFRSFRRTPPLGSEIIGRRGGGGESTCIVIADELNCKWPQLSWRGAGIATWLHHGCIRRAPRDRTDVQNYRHESPCTSKRAVLLGNYLANSLRRTTTPSARGSVQFQRLRRSWRHAHSPGFRSIGWIWIRTLYPLSITPLFMPLYAQMSIPFEAGDLRASQLTDT